MTDTLEYIRRWIAGAIVLIVISFFIVGLWNLLVLFFAICAILFLPFLVYYSIPFSTIAELRKDFKSRMGRRHGS